jgi:hypothetical protein
MWYDGRMFPGNFLRRTVQILLVLLIGFPLVAVSLVPGSRFEDPNASQTMLAGRDFTKALTASEQLSADLLELHLTTMGKGDPLYVWFGHTGLVVTDKRNNRSVMYDYGIFSFDDDFYQTFAMGRLNYEVWATSAEARYDLARSENRDISNITIHVPDAAKMELVRFLNYNIQPENSTYLYHHYRENCSTRIRDIIDKAVDGQFQAWARAIPMDETLRQLVMRHTYASPFIDWTLNFLQSGSIDKPISLWEAMFLPAVLEQALLDFSYIDESGHEIPIATDRRILNSAPVGARAPVLESYQSMTLPGFWFGLLVGLVSLLFGRVIASSQSNGLRRFGQLVEGLLGFAWAMVVGVLSSLLLFMMLASSHDVTYFNENIVFATPWALVMAVQSLRGAFGKDAARRRFRQANTIMAILVGTTIVMKVIFLDLLVQQNWQILLTLLPMYLCNSSIPFERFFERKRRILDDSDW